MAAVDGVGVTVREYDHWARISARALRVRVVPKPPEFKKCVAAKKGKRRKARCQAEFTRVRDETLNFLLPAKWIAVEATERGLSVTDAEVEQEFIKQRDAQFKTDAAYLDFKDDTLQTDNDLRYKVRVSLLSDRVRNQVLSQSGATSGQGAVMQRFEADYRAKWFARTVCTKRYRSVNCGTGR